MSNPYKLSSAGLLFLLLQAALVALMMIAIAVGVGTKNRDLMDLLTSKMVLCSSAIVLLGLIGKLMCLIANTGAGGRVAVALSLLGDVGYMAIPLLVFLSEYAVILSTVPFFLFAIYMILLARELKRPDIVKIVISSIGCFVVSSISFVVMRVYKTDTTFIAGGITLLATCVYGTMLYLRALTFLRRAIAAWPPASDVATDPDTSPGAAG